VVAVIFSIDKIHRNLLFFGEDRYIIITEILTGDDLVIAVGIGFRYTDLCLMPDLNIALPREFWLNFLEISSKQCDLWLWKVKLRANLAVADILSRN